MDIEAAISIRNV